MPPALDAEGLLASVEVGIAVPLRVVEVLDPIGAAVEAAMLLVEGLAAGQALKSNSRRSSSMVGWLSLTAVIRQSAPQQSSRQRAVSWWAWRASAVTVRPERSSTPANSWMAGISLVLRAISSCPGTKPLPRATARPDRLLRARIDRILHDVPALLPGPARQGHFQRLRRRGGEDVVERNDRRRGVALDRSRPRVVHPRICRNQRRATGPGAFGSPARWMSASCTVPFRTAYSVSGCGSVRAKTARSAHNS